ncbi:transposase [Mycolicibacterium sp. TY66]|uniref:transposase n=1 Tax=Mycolicibacterium sp. TY66 TaxID=2755560 RepID=UPI003530244C
MFVGLAPGTGESTDAWADFLTDLGDRGLGCPLLVVSDGAKGLIAAIETNFSQKRCGRDVLFIDSATCSRRFPPGCKPRSATATGPSSIPPI